jgi:8-oxo-dGTP pyrophosphatase MutT (NUDIX family)
MSEDSFFDPLRERLSGRPVGVFGEVSPGALEPRPASVLIPLFLREQAPQILVIRRTEELPTHPGQIAFPGGSREPGDADDWATATREAREEIGLREEDCERLGALDRLITFTGFDISPFVARIPHPYRFTPAPGEVAAIHILPLGGFLEASAYQPVVREVRGVAREIPSYLVQGVQVWGVTGYLVQQLLELVRPLL